MDLDNIWLEASRLVPEEVGIPREDLSRCLPREQFPYFGYCDSVKTFQFHFLDYDKDYLYGMSDLQNLARIAITRYSVGRYRTCSLICDNSHYVEMEDCNSSRSPVGRALVLA